MYKHAHRFLLTLSNKVRQDVTLNTIGFVNNNFMRPGAAVSKISLTALTYSITKRNFSLSTFTNTESDSDSEPEQNSNQKLNPSVEMQKKLQQEAQERLDDLLEKDPALNKFYKILELEIEVFRQSGKKVPNKLQPTEWLQLIKMQTQNARKKFLEFLWINEIRNINVKIRKQNAMLKKVEELKSEEPHEKNDVEYGLSHNTMFHRIYKTTINQFTNRKLINAIMFGDKLVLDCGFESTMTYKEITSCAKQIMFAFSSNRNNKLPFDLYLCNLDPQGELKRRLLSFFPTMDDPGYPMNSTSKSYLEIFPKEKLVYLTPNTTNVLQKYNPDDVYIIGAIVDKRNCKPLTLAKAKEENLRVAKFPLDNYLDWKSGSNKNLNVNHCLEILMNIKNTNDWDQALRVVPRRKILHSEYGNKKEYNNKRENPRVFQNYEPKFQSGQASHTPDFIDHNKVGQKK